MVENERLRQQRERYKRRKAAHPTLCRICGKAVEPIHLSSGRMASRHYHDECLVDEAIKAVMDGYTMDGHPALKRMKNREITRTDILEIMQERGIEYNEKTRGSRRMNPERTPNEQRANKERTERKGYYQKNLKEY